MILNVLQDPEGGCTVRQMTVNFAELGWGEWIISPDKFDANYCTGSCRFPLTKVKQLITMSVVCRQLSAITSPPRFPLPCFIQPSQHHSKQTFDSCVLRDDHYSSSGGGGVGPTTQNKVICSSNTQCSTR